MINKKPVSFRDQMMKGIKKQKEEFITEMMLRVKAEVLSKIYPAISEVVEQQKRDACSYETSRKST